jgi:hypothetical protein
MAEDYEFDIFLSYRHRPPVIDWLQRYFYPMLAMWLPDAMDRDPKIFVDWGIEVGSTWPDALREGLLRSRCLLAIWTPQYFRSPWCLAEWQSFRAREELLATRSSGLIYPIVYADGDYFPEEAKRTQSKDLRSLNSPQPAFRKTERCVDLDAKVQEIAGELALMIN